MAKPWERYQQPPEQPAAGPWGKYADPRQRPVESFESKAAKQRAEDMERYAPTRPTIGLLREGKYSDALDQGQAGFAQSFINAGRGIKQLGAESLLRHAGMLEGGLRAAGLDSAADAAGRNLTRPAAQFERTVQREVDEARELDAPLLATGGGMTGAVVGNISQLLGPGLALRGTTAGRMLLPTTIGGNAAQGAALGYVQPTASGESRGGKAAIGGTVGAVIPAALKAPGAAIRAVKSAARPERAAAEEAVRIVQREAQAPNIGTAGPNPSQIPGVTRSLYEETLDPGIARLETASRGTGTGWADRDSANNLARQAALREFAGDEASIAAAEEARSAATGQLRRQAFAEGDAALRQAAEAGFDVSGNLAGLRDQFSRIAQGQGGRSAVKRAIQDVMADLDDAAPTVQGLYNVRKSIGDLLSGKAGADKAYARAASAELMQMRDLLDAELVNLAPSFEQYLTAFQSMSRPINRMQVGQELIARGSGQLDPLTGEGRLMPAQFGRQVRDLDRLAQSATGFGKAQAADMLQPDDFARINAVNDDLARSASRLVRGAGGGSHTASQQEVGKRIAVRSLARVIPGVGAAVEFLESQNAQRLEKALERVLANPDEYRAIAALINRQDRRLLEQALIRIAGPGASGAVRADGRQPVTPVKAAALTE